MITAIALIVLGLFGLTRGLPRVWSGKTYAPRRHQDPWVAGLVRLLPTATVCMVGFAVLIIIGNAITTPPAAAPTWFGAIIAVYMAVVFGLLAAIFFFNPAILQRVVPPNRRSERGVLRASSPARDT